MGQSTPSFGDHKYNQRELGRPKMRLGSGVPMCIYGMGRAAIHLLGARIPV